MEWGKTHPEPACTLVSTMLSLQNPSTQVLPLNMFSISSISLALLFYWVSAVQISILLLTSNSIKNGETASVWDSLHICLYMQSSVPVRHRFRFWSYQYTSPVLVHYVPVSSSASDRRSVWVSPSLISRCFLDFFFFFFDSMSFLTWPQVVSTELHLTQSPAYQACIVTCHLSVLFDWWFSSM